MGYYSTLNKQLGEYNVDAKRQNRNDIKQMIKYQAFLENEAIDDRLADKLATMYGDVQKKIANKQKPLKVGLIKPNGTTSTQTGATTKSSFTQMIQIPASLKTKKQEEKFRTLINEGVSIDLDALNNAKDPTTYLNNQLTKLQGNKSKNRKNKNSVIASPPTSNTSSTDYTSISPILS
jgi:hypothetical protein